MTFDLISLVPIRLQLFKGDPISENQHFPHNYTSDEPSPWFMSFDLSNIRRNPYCIFDPSYCNGTSTFQMRPE